MKTFRYCLLVFSALASTMVYLRAQEPKNELRVLSVAGSYLASLVIYEKLFGKSPVGLPASLKLRSKTLEKIELPQEHAELLQVAATEANKKF